MAYETDDFSGTIANWTSSTAFRMQVSGGLFRANGGGDPALEYRNTFTPANNQVSQCVIKTFDSAANCGIGPAVRASTSADTCYWFLHNTIDEFRLVYMLAGSISATIGTYTAGTPAVNDVMRVEANGTTIRALVNGVERISGTHSALTSGRVAVRSLIVNTVAEVDLWEGGDLAATLSAAVSFAGAGAYSASVAPTAVLTGTALASITEADIVTGGKTIIITLAGATWQPAA